MMPGLLSKDVMLEYLQVTAGLECVQFQNIVITLVTNVTGQLGALSGQR